MGNKEKVKSLTVYCDKGHKLWRYRKIGGGRLIKCYEDEIGRDYTGQISEELELGAIIYCTQCEPIVAVAFLTLIHGRRAYELEQSNVRRVRT